MKHFAIEVPVQCKEMIGTKRAESFTHGTGSLLFLAGTAQLLSVFSLVMRRRLKPRYVFSNAVPISSALATCGKKSSENSNARL